MPVKKVKTEIKKPKVTVKTVVEKKVASASGLSVPAYSIAGRVTGTLELPKELFAAVVNKQLLAQAVRVYSTNQKTMLAKTKTRGEVKGSKAKIYRQKGTGRARHGAITAPIFVGGGIVFGPQVRNVRLDLPQRMKKAALISALSFKMADKNIIGLSGAEKATGKTKEMAALLKKVNPGKISTLVVTPQGLDNVVRGFRNIPDVSVLPANLLNAYEVLRHEMLLITKEAVDILSGKGKTESVK